MHRITERSQPAAELLIKELLDDSVPFAVEPLPDDEWSIYITNETARYYRDHAEPVPADCHPLAGR